MKKQRNPGIATGMTRVKILAITCAASAGIYLAVQYVRKEGLPRITWRKAEAKKVEPEAVLDTESDTRLALPNHPSARPDPTAEAAADPFVLLFSNNVQRRVESGNASSGTPLIRSDKSRQQKVEVPPNALWSTNSVRKGPGVKIAYP